MHWAGGVCIPACTGQGCVCIPACAGQAGCLPRGVSQHALGRGLAAQGYLPGGRGCLADTPSPCEQND